MRYRPSLMRDEAGIVRVEKAHGFVTHRSRLLVFSHRDLPESGVQIPAGTIRAGEAPEVAVLREVEEETGLVDLILIGLLGSYDYRAEPRIVPAGHENQRRYAFHLHVRGEVRESWVHWELGDGDTSPIAFELYWIPIREARNTLVPFIGDQGVAVLKRLQERVGE